MSQNGKGVARFGAQAKRRFFAALGLLCVGIGIVGVIVPGLPGTIFLLAASYLFVRSSPRLQRWLHEHPRLGPYLRLAESGVMPRRAKVVTLTAIWGSILAVLLLGTGSAVGRVILVALGLVGTGVILFRIRTAPAASPES